MASLVSALDNYTPKKVGENNHVEYGWSNNLNEKIVQFFFQLVRTKTPENLKKQHRTILNMMRGNEKLYKKQFSMMYKLIGQTRDIVKGKGEQQLAFMQILNFYESGYRILAISAIKKFVIIENEHPYGSWKDIKYFCKYIKEVSPSSLHAKEHTLVKFSCSLIIEQLLKDTINLQQGDSSISLAARWVPREKSSFKWVNEIIAKLMYPKIITSAKSQKSKEKALIKAKIKLKKMYTPLNKKLNTPQIDQCAKNWSNINFNNITSCTMRKQSRAFANKDKKNQVRSNDPDRVACSNNFKTHMEAAKSDPTNHKVRGRKCSVGDLARDAMNVGMFENNEVDRINLQWEDNKKNNKGLGNIIPCCDTSGSMEADNKTPLVNAIGLSVRASELADDAFKNRILTFDEKPEWVQLNSNLSFVEKVKQVKNSRWGMSTNIYAMFDLLLNVIVENEIPPLKVENFILAIFSDMQINCSIDLCTTVKHDEGAFSHYMNTLYDNIKMKFNQAGMRSKFKTPYKPPHILFWNLRSTQGFPTLSTEKNVTMLSGFSSSLLNIFCDKGIDAIKEYSPSNMLEEILNDERYAPMETDLDEFYEFMN